MTTIVFDLDGTLADTAHDLINAGNQALEAFGAGARLHHRDDRATAYEGGRPMIRLGFKRADMELDDATLEAVYQRLLAEYDVAMDVHTRLYPGAESAIARLADQGHLCVICTNKPVEMAERLVGKLDIRSQFHSLVGAGSLSVSKPDPAPFHKAVTLAGGDVSDAIMVGDTGTDRKTAIAAGVPCIIVDFPPEGRADLETEPEAWLPHYDQIDEVVARLTARQ